VLDEYGGMMIKKKKKKLRGFGPLANHADRGLTGEN
jgi:hypothetical protein